MENNTVLVEVTSKAHGNLVGESLNENLELIDKVVLLHDFEKLDKDLGGLSRDNVSYGCPVRTVDFLEETINNKTR